MEAGPGKWVATGLHPEGVAYERGLSGGAHDSVNGSAEFLNLVSGAGTNVTREVTITDGKTAEFTFRFANPMAIRGKSNVFEKMGVSPLLKRLPVGTTVDTVTEVAAFIPDHPDEYLRWAGHYMKIADGLKEAGVEPDPNTRGGRFLRKLRTIWERRDPTVRGSGYEQLGDLFWEFTRGPEGP